MFSLVAVFRERLDRRQRGAAAGTQRTGGLIGVVVAAGLRLLVVDLAVASGLLALEFPPWRSR